MRKIICLTILAVTAASTVWAQSDRPKEQPPVKHADGKVNTFASPEMERSALLEAYFFAPEFIMQHQHAIGLTPQQQTAIRGEMQQMMAQFTDLQWRESAEVELLSAIIKNEQPDEKQAMAELDKLLDIENQIKRLHTQMLIRIKSLLTPEQQALLRDLKRGGNPQPKVGK